MVRISKILLTFVVLFSTSLSAWADRGIGKKSKARAFSLNIATPSTLRSSVSLNLKSGLVYKGSTLGSATGTSASARSIISYQKGNNVYVLPYKHKIAVPEVKQGYAGLKLIIRSN
jgi:hypothetical protein